MAGPDGVPEAQRKGHRVMVSETTPMVLAEDITRRPDGSTTFRVVFPADPEHIWHPEGREPLTVTLQPGEKVRWKDGRPYRMREGSELTVIIDPDGGPPTVYHQKYE